MHRWDDSKLGFRTYENSSISGSPLPIGCSLLKTYGYFCWWAVPWICPPSVYFSHSVVSNSLQPNGLQHVRLPCPSSTTGACSNSCPLSWWYHPAISSSVVPFSSWLQSFLASGSSLVSQFLTSGGQIIGVSASASVLPMNVQDLFPLRLTGLMSWQTKGLSRVFPNTTVQKHQFFGTQLSSYSNSHIDAWTGKTRALTRQTFVGKVMSLHFNMLSRFAIAFLPHI